ncbi:MAG: M48 family metallopeptidase [Bacteroidales bacterium]|nr:M48 family metallopeptidase [Bacteroidales bacterium]
MTRLFLNPFTGRLFTLVARRRKPRKAPVNARVESLRAQAKKELPPRLAELAAQHGFKYNKVFIKNNISNWGSCSSLGNINLNLRLVELPSELQDYVMLHELCHLRYLNHGREFHALLEFVCPGHRALARQLRAHRLTP